MSRPCPKCAAEDFRPAPSSTGREGGVRCNRCETFWWQPTPENEKERRPAKHLDLVKKYGRGFCEYCGLSVARLVELKRHLVGHHVVECGPDGSKSSDARDNVWIICNACHSSIHHARTYHGEKRGPVLSLSIVRESEG